LRAQTRARFLIKKSVFRQTGAHTKTQGQRDRPGDRQEMTQTVTDMKTRSLAFGAFLMIFVDQKFSNFANGLGLKLMNNLQ